MRTLRFTPALTLGLASLALLFSACGRASDVIVSNTTAASNAAANTATTSPSSRPEAAPSKAQVTEVKIYLVALGDNGKNGKKVGCEDSLVPVTRNVPATAAPLKAALLELFADREPDKKETDLNLGNYWRGMQLKSVAIEDGTAIIHLTGEAPSVAGICDEPRIKGQIIETARQFQTVKKVKVFINGKPMNDVISPV
jgi:spore germination protein GerM